ncbi:MAG: metal-dependent transcriptional regulator [Synergistales bacterium]|nr:metal-dependent transcriptional regulator [Synergistales bacterium]
MALSCRIEDYLEEILSLEMEGEEPSVTALSKKLDVSKASVVSALRRLNEEGLLEQEKYCTPQLTPEGREKAMKIFRRHQHLTFLLRDIIGLQPSVASDIACVMEHALDTESEKRLAAFVDFYCLSLKERRQWIDRMQEGLEHPSDLSHPLLLMKEGESGKVVRITAQELVRKRLHDSGFLQGTRVRFLSSDCHERIVRVELEGEETVLSIKEAMSIWILGE